MKQMNIGKLKNGIVLSLAGIAATGLHDEVDLDVKHTTEAILRGKQEDTKQKEHEYQSSRKACAAAQKALTESFGQALTFAQVTRDNLKPALGSQYSQAWSDVGFVNGTLRMPRSVLSGMALISAMQLFLQGHPELVVPETVTPELAAETYNTLKAACTALNQAKTAMRQKKALRDEAMADLRRSLMFLRRELTLLLAESDPRWVVFGFNVPADVSVPHAPEGLTVISEQPGEAQLSWGKTANTERFHVWQQVMGVDAEPMRIATVTTTAKQVTGLLSAARVRFSITALNAAGESLASETVEITIT